MCGCEWHGYRSRLLACEIGACEAAALGRRCTVARLLVGTCASRPGYVAGRMTTLRSPFSQLQFLMKDYDGALETYQQGMEHDKDSADLKDGITKCITQIQRVNAGQLGEEELRMRQERAMQDPEIQRILTDPVMVQVLKELRENPESASTHLGSPEIFTKLMKLQRAGILRMG